jgi:hypothetical protein
MCMAKSEDGGFYQNLEGKLTRPGSIKMAAERGEEGRWGGKLKESRSSLLFVCRRWVGRTKALEENKESGWNVSDKDEERDGRE